ncbi:helix-turn-helix domain-containing protein [Listeria sp. PSOL-1]|uniref:helix-turn-helix domain-containing protein n=1 Tax=Listeria sp. PSOL-1 TaxID=1844999 RepID=UPI0013D3EEA7|nr:helix-turn-helix domain-containing protein [Listeria sp. PSOL-1]
MDSLDQYLLFLLKKLVRPRKLPFLHAVMTGRRIGQTIQDIHLFKAEAYFGLLPNLSKELLQERCEKLLRSGAILQSENGFILAIDFSTPDFLRKDWNGFRACNRPQQFFKRLMLLVQVLSNKKYDKAHYLPIIRDKEVQIFIKQWLNRYGKNEQIRTNLHEELYRFSANQPYPELYIYRLSGGDWIGETAAQIAEKLALPLYESYFEWRYGLEQLILAPAAFPILQTLIAPVFSNLTNSSYFTYEKMKQGMSSKQLASIRNLKLSTIQDHIVEIAATLPTEFPLTINQEIQKALQETEYTSLKEIKQLFPEWSYFDIRLAVVLERSLNEARAST